jgi:hypothetical protein
MNKDTTATVSGFTILALAVLASGCGYQAADETPANDLGSVSQEARGVGAGGGGGAGLQMATRGLFVIDAPAAGEAAIAGLVNTVSPLDAIITLNGVPLVPFSQNFFTVNPTGPQPTLGADGILHLVLSSASAKATRLLDLVCPARLDVTATPAVGSSLAGASAVTLSWSSFPQNTPSVINFFDPNHAQLDAFDPATGAVEPLSAFVILDQTKTSVSLPVRAVPSAGHLARLRYAGQYLLDGNSGGVCGREEHLSFAP